MFDGALTAAGGHGPLAIGSQAHFANIASHAAVGCLSAAASGGSCKSGALSGAAGAAATPLVGKVFSDPENNLGDYVGGTAASGVVGGLASVAGGGKFENGAVTAAFGYMFNNCFSCLQKRNADPRLSGRADNADGVFGLLVPLVGAGRALLLGAGGTVWDSIVATQGVYEGTVIPRSFTLATEGADVWVAPNASKHLAEWAYSRLGGGLGADMVGLESQLQLNSLQAAIGQATSNGVSYGTLIRQGGWELMFSPARQAGQLPVLKHALPY
jgi:hypothetical protein